MRDRYHQLLARLRRHRPASDEEPERDVIPDALYHQVRDAFPRPVVSDTLQARVANICREAVTAVPSDRRGSLGNRRSWMRIARWASLGLTVAALAVIWMSDRPGGEALAATIRAMGSVPAIHSVSKSDRGGHGERWIVDGVGLYLYSHGRDMKSVIVDDLTYQYRYTVPLRPDSGIPEPRVEITPSEFAHPERRAEIMEWHTGVGMLKELQAGRDAGEPRMKWIRQNGRRLRQIHVPGPGRGTTICSDPETDRIVWYEVEGPNIRSDPERVRFVLDYPSPASVNRSRFRFEVPRGVVVWDHTEAPTRWARGDEATCLDRMKMLREALRRYANAHGGSWPESLRPALEPYVKSAEVFHCPLAPPATVPDTSYRYQRPSREIAAQALEQWNRRKADPSAHTHVGLMSARPAVLECRHHSGTVFSLYGDGNVHRWYPER
jgi:hypothetical protein